MQRVFRADDLDVSFLYAAPTFEAGHEPQDTSDFKSIIKMLLKVHDYGFVHGNIRMANFPLHTEMPTIDGVKSKNLRLMLLQVFLLLFF